MKRHEAREKALQALFQIDMNEMDANEAINNILDGELSDSFLTELVTGTIQHLAEIDAALKENLEKWTLDRVAKVDKAILRMAVYEMKFIESIPVNVSIDEAVELAKSFGDDSSSRFVNGVLSKVKDSIQ